jgi:hypothetical protein
MYGTTQRTALTLRLPSPVVAVETARISDYAPSCILRRRADGTTTPVG